MKKSKRVIVSILVAAITIISVGVITAYAESRTYQGITAEYYQNTSGARIALSGTGKSKHCALTTKAQYNSNCNNWPVKDHYGVYEESLYFLSISGSQTALSAGIGYDDYNSNNFLFKYNY